MKLRPCQWTDAGKIRRIRGVAYEYPILIYFFYSNIYSRYAMRVSPSLANRLIETAKGLLLKFLPDVYIYVDHQKGQNAGL
jgi:RNA 3'-terminal phosphate cyclase-like protein